MDLKSKPKNKIYATVFSIVLLTWQDKKLKRSFPMCHILQEPIYGLPEPVKKHFAL